MAAAYTHFLPHLKMIGLTGVRPWLRRDSIDLVEMFGLSRPVRLRRLPLLWSQQKPIFEQDYLPPRWFYSLVGHYARLYRASLIFTRKPETAVTTIQAGLNTVLETHVPWESMPHLHGHRDLLCSPALRTLVVVTPPLGESFSRAGFPEDRIQVEPDGVDLEQYTPQLTTLEARRKLGLSEVDFLCVYTGHLYRDRGIEVMIQAARQLENVHILIVGGWERDIAHYQKMAQETEATNVTFTGIVPHVKIPLYQFAADLLLMQYSNKTHHAERCSPIKVFEYLAAGRPIVSTDLPILQTVLHHEKNAIMVEPDSKESLVEAIQRIRNQPELAKKIATNARDDSTRYTWEERAHRILNHTMGAE
ncbi:MAG: glycosyltransferase [Planctomycetota bacterium]